MVLTLNHIEKSFGTKRVLDDVSFEVRSGQALGLLGRNGAGKTTIIRILMDILSKNGGEILLDGKPLKNNNISFGYLPEEHGLYPKKKIGSQLCYIGMLKGLSKTESSAQTTQLLRRVRLLDVQSKRLDTLSKGNQQKIQLVATLLGNPQIIILDEPFSGLDPVNAQLLKDIVKDLSNQDKIVLFSSHQMSYVEEFCDEVALLNGGKIALYGNLNRIKDSYPKDSVLVLANPSFETFASTLPFVQSVAKQKQGYIVKLNQESDYASLLQHTIDEKIVPQRFEVMQPTLEDIFVEKAGDQV